MDALVSALARDGPWPLALLAVMMAASWIIVRLFKWVERLQDAREQELRASASLVEKMGAVLSGMENINRRLDELFRQRR